VYFGESRGLPLLLDLLKLHQIYWPVDWWVTDHQAFDLVLPSDAPRVVSHLLSSNQQLDVKKGRIGMRLSEAPISHWAASVLRLIVAREAGAVEIGGEFDLPAGRFVLEQGVFYPVSTPSKP
jgi:hypothetical protein